MRLRKVHIHEDNDEGFGGGDAQVFCVRVALQVLADAMTYFVRDVLSESCRDFL